MPQTRSKPDFEDTLSAEGRKIVSAIKMEIKKIHEDFLSKLEEKNREILVLKGDVSYLRGRVSQLEERIDDADAYERRDTLIISGEGLPPVVEDENTSTLACSIIKEKLKINLTSSDISTSHRLGRKPNDSQRPDRRKIILKLCRRDLKKDILYASKSLKPNIYVNESLTPLRNTILYVLRKMKKSHPNVIKGSSTYDGRVFAWITTGETTRRILVNSHDKLGEVSTEIIGKPLSEFILEWPH